MRVLGFLKIHIFIIALIGLIFLFDRSCVCLAQEFEPGSKPGLELTVPERLPEPEDAGQVPAETFADAEIPGEAAEASGLTGRIWSRMKGRKARNAVVLGMWSSHFSKRKDYRTRHDLVGVQYKGFFCATFANSHNHQVVTAGVSRTIVEKALGRNWLLEAGYKLGPMYGYREGVPQYHRFTVLPLLALGLSFQAVGADLNLVPGNAFSFNMRINF